MVSGKIRFVLGILRHPRQAWRRLRELYRIVTAPPESSVVSTGSLSDVDLIPVTQIDTLGRKLVEMYANNPSPFVSGPASIDKLELSMSQGVRYYLVANDRGEFVGARAFDPDKKLLLSRVTDYRYRGRGYQLSASKKMFRHLIKEGHKEIYTAVYRDNSRMLRTMAAEGWRLEADPDNPDLIRGTIKLSSELD